MTAPGLLETQARFQAFILREVESAPPGLQAPGVDVYAEAYTLRLTEALANDCPVLRQVVGEQAFADMATAYALARPSRHFSVRWFGRQLADFLRSTPPYQAEPWLAELAAFEWLMGEAFDAANAPVIGPDRLANLPAAAWPDLRFAFHPSLRRLDVQHDVAGLWQLHLSGEVAAVHDVRPASAQLAIWRRDLSVYFRPLEAGEALSLDALVAGTPLSAACEQLATAIAPGDDAAPRIVGWLQRWLADGLIVSIA